MVKTAVSPTLLRGSYILSDSSGLDRDLPSLLFFVLRMYHQTATATSIISGHSWAIYWASRRVSSIPSHHTRISRRIEQETGGKEKIMRMVSYFRPGRIQYMRDSALCSLGTISRQQLHQLGLSFLQCDLQWGPSLLVLCVSVGAMR